MSETFFSQQWYRVANLKPRLRGHAEIHRHRYRGQVRYVLQDHASGRMHLFTPAAYQFIGMMDGERSVNALWQAVAADLAGDAPTQDEAIHLLSQLHAADMLQCDVPPDAAELFERFGKQSRAIRRRNLWNPLSIRIPLWDPDRFLGDTLPLVRPLLGWAGVLVWLAVVVPALVLAGMHWPELAGNLSDRVLAAHNLALLWLTYPFIKALHELGHGYATKAGGGEVHDLGIMLLVFTPIPYVDASAATALRSKWHRAAVGAMGMLVETFLAALAMYLWVSVEPGLIRSIAFNVILIAGVSTVLFNGNPLLRYDGYYVLADLVEIPNLATRSARFWGYLVQRYAFGLKEPGELFGGMGERLWLACYGAASFVYRLLVLFAIVLFVAGEFFVVGVLIAIWGLAMSLVVPTGKAIGRLLKNPRLQRKRPRAVLVTLAVGIGVVALLLLIPAPLRTTAEGVVWLPDKALVRAGTNGFLRRLLVDPGEVVQAGEALVESEDAVLSAELRVYAARVAELEVRLAAQRFADRVQAEITRQELEREQASLRRLQERSDQLVAGAESDGTFVVPQPEDLPGRFVRKGEVLGYITQAAPRIARVVVEQDDVELVRERLLDVQLRLADRIAETYPTRVVREVPGAADQLPSPVLGTAGGGQIAMDPRDPKGNKTLERLFQLDLELPQDIERVSLGSRVYVRFDHTPEPLGVQWYRRLRQLLLARFNV